MIQNPFNIYTKISNSFYVTVYLVWVPVIFRLYNFIGFPYWLINLPGWYLLTSVCISKRLFNHGYDSSKFCAVIHFTLSDISWVVIDDTVHLSHNCPSFGTQGRLILDIDIDPYYIYRFLYLFSLFYSTGEPATRDQAGGAATTSSNL